MSHDLICSWLGLAPGTWPPDHYRLLGLTPGENNAALIEQSVHQRLDNVRRYQMAHQEEATEAMNRLAQAFVCLTDPAGKRAYDAALYGAPLAAATVPSRVGRDSVEELLEARDPLAWMYDPPPPRNSAAPTDEVPAAPTPTVVEVPLPPAHVPGDIPLPPPPPPPEPVDPLVQAAESRHARKGLGTKRALYYRISRTRQLIDLWYQAGKYLASPKRRLTRKAEATDLMRKLNDVQDLLEGFPPLLGEAGQPGYLVIALSRLVIVPTFQSLGPSQREALSRDWNSGLKLLLSHRDFLRRELRMLRRRPLPARLARAVRTFLNEHPGTLLILLGLLALNLVLWRSPLLDLWHSLSGR